MRAFAGWHNLCSAEEAKARVSNKSLLISAAVFFVAFGALVTVFEHVRHPPATPFLNFTGIAGLYLGLCAVVEHVRWLYVPAVFSC